MMKALLRVLLAIGALAFAGDKLHAAGAPETGKAQPAPRHGGTAGGVAKGKPGQVTPNSPVSGGGGNLTPINCNIYPDTGISWTNHWIFINGIPPIYLNSNVTVTVSENCDTPMGMGVAFTTVTPQGTIANALTDGLSGHVCGNLVSACSDGRSSLTTIRGTWTTGFANVFELTQAQQAQGYVWVSWDPTCSINGPDMACDVDVPWTLP